jgi:hypothetical protein
VDACGSGAGDTGVVESIKGCTDERFRVLLQLGPAATFQGKVAHVVGMSAKPQVLRIHTARSVAAMTYTQARRDLPNKELVRKAMSGISLVLPEDHSVTTRITSAFPEPTIASVLWQRIDKLQKLLDTTNFVIVDALAQGTTEESFLGLPGVNRYVRESHVVCR